MPEVTFGLKILRGVVSLGIGVFLLFNPEKTAPILANVMGFFWLFAGIGLLRLSADDNLVKTAGHRTTRTVAIAGILAGLLVLTRNLTLQVVPEGAFVTLLGFVILLTGLIHIFGDLRAGGAEAAHDRWLHVLLGLFEVVLGLTLVISPLDRSPVTYWIGTIWGLVFGVLVIFDAILGRTQARRTGKGVAPVREPSSGQ